MTLTHRRRATDEARLRSVVSLTTSGWSPRFGPLWATAAEIWSDAVVVHVTFGYDHAADPNRFPVFLARDDEGRGYPTFCVSTAGDGRRWHETVTIGIDARNLRHLDVQVAWAGPSASASDDGELLCSVPLGQWLRLVDDVEQVRHGG